jgi:hypothetical protein
MSHGGLKIKKTLPNNQVFRQLFLNKIKKRKSRPLKRSRVLVVLQETYCQENNLVI